METRILLVDDHTMVREALRAKLEAVDHLTVVGEARDGREAVEAAQELRPDVIVMDIWLPRLSGLAATQEIVKADRNARVLILSVHEGRSFVEDAFRAGAIGYVVKSGSVQELLEAIDAVRQGRSYLSPAITQHVVGAIRDPRDSASSGLSALSSREREVLQRIAEGLASKEIAADLHLSRRTVETHRANLMRKLGAHKASSLVRIAIREGLVSP
jgi:DNA-binding NarL/FixJ family response regulator